MQKGLEKELYYQRLHLNLHQYYLHQQMINLINYLEEEPYHLEVDPLTFEMLYSMKKVATMMVDKLVHQQY
ncbi:MAG: hypothetical protein CMG85_18565 [Marinobacter sp.]|nr:hypothetical protein [Marinobacter sp.]